MQLIKRSKIIGTGEATPRGPQTIPIFRTQNQGTRSSLMKTTSARQNALAKLKRADRNVLDASMLKERREEKVRPSGPSEARKPKSKKLQHIERPRARYVCTVCGCAYCSNNCIVTPSLAHSHTVTQPVLDSQNYSPVSCSPLRNLADIA